MFSLQGFWLLWGVWAKVCTSASVFKNQEWKLESEIFVNCYWWSKDEWKRSKEKKYYKEGGAKSWRTKGK